MQKKSKLESAATISYIVISVLFILVFLYMALFENTNVYEARDARTYTVVNDCSVKEIADSQAPAEIRKEYSWMLENTETNENSLGFYLVHHYAQVYFDDELMYSLMPSEDNKICSSVSSNWIFVPIYPEDSGKEVRVIVTPVYKSVANFKVEFEIGPRSSIYFHRLKLDLPQIILSTLCILIGLIIMTVQVCLVVKKKTETWDMFYLGNFSILLGIWKITDTRISPLMFNGNTLVLGYIAIGMLFLGTIPILLFMKERFSGYKNTYIAVETLIFCGVALVVLLCQLFGVAEFKQTLTLSHFLIIIALLTLILTVSRRRRSKTGNRSKWNLNFAFFLIPGILADMLFFYINRSSSGIIFTIAAFLAYALSLFTRNFLDINKKAKTDAQTGLFNKSRWDQLMNDKSPILEPIGIMMIDLNRLKYINDTMGHEAGDKMIFNFSNILRNSIPHSNVICRWGGRRVHSNGYRCKSGENGVLPVEY